MTNAEKSAYIRRAMESYKSDDLERAQNAFNGLCDAQMDTAYGQSGQTRKEILEGYGVEREKWNECTAWLSHLFKEAK